MYAARLRRPSGGRQFVGWLYQEAEVQLARLKGGYGVFWSGALRRDSSASSLLGSASLYTPDTATACTFDDVPGIPSVDELTILDELPPQASSR